MKKLIILTLLFSSLTITNSVATTVTAVGFDWVDGDKVGHIVTNYFFTDVLKERLNSSRETTFWLLFGLDTLKEVYDYASYGVFDVNDIIAGLIGWGVASLVNYDINIKYENTSLAVGYKYIW